MFSSRQSDIVAENAASRISQQKTQNLKILLEHYISHLTLCRLSKCLLLSLQPTTNVEEELEEIKTEEKTLLGHLSEGQGEGVRRRRRGREVENGGGGGKTLAEVQHRKAQLGKTLVLILAYNVGTHYLG